MQIASLMHIVAKQQLKQQGSAPELEDLAAAIRVCVKCPLCESRTKAVPGDGPSQAMLARIDGWIASPPGADWDGAWRFERK